MNNRTLNVNLSLALINKKGSASLQSIKELIEKIGDVGSFMKERLLEHFTLDDKRALESYQLQFEHGTIGIEMINHKASGQKYIRGIRVL